MNRLLRVLHLEDRPRDAEIIRDRLEADGLPCNILVVNGKDTFTSALAGEPFDLILSDYNLPGYDGIAALKQAQAAQPDVPVILISGTVVEEQAVNCLHIGATDYLLKGRLERLVPAVKRAVQEAEARRAQKRVEAALTESESRKAAILDSVLDCIVTMDADGIVLEYNAAAVRTFGYSKAEAIGRPLADLIVPPAFRDRHRAGLARYVATGEGTLIGTLIEITAMRSDGSDIPVELTITAIRTGQASIFTGVLRDITARKQADANRAQLASIVDASDDAIFSIDLHDNILSWNAGAERLYGYTAKEMIGRSRGLLVPPGNTAELVPVMKRVLAGEAGQCLETQRVRKDGSVVEVSLMSSPMMDPTGRVTTISTIARDITGRNQAVEALRQAEERTRFALQASKVGSWDMDYTTGILRWSDAMEAQYGLPPGTFNGTFEGFAQWIHPDDRASVLETIGKAMKTGADFTTLHRSLAKDGTVRWLSGAGRILLDENGAPVRGVGISQDVTERRLLEEQYQQAQKMEAIGRLAAGVAHDFNNLLTVILGFCELLLTDLDPADPRQTDIAEIQKAGTRAAGLTRQLLAFSRKEIIEPTLLDLNVIVTGIRVLIERLIGEDIKVVLVLGRALAFVKADRGQVEQIILNLAVNARDAMPKGGTLTIDTANMELDEHRAKTRFAVKSGSYVALTVTDTGTGMTREVQARLFEPFFTTKGAGKGTGLGLATVHGIVMRADGSVNVESVLGRGTSFTVYLPSADAAEVAALAPPPTAPRPRAAGQTVLVVEDAEGLRELTKRLLERQGHTVLLAANADEALQLFDANPSIDLLLTDVVMPGASGPELVKQLVERRPALRVIYMSGYTDEAIVHHGVLDPGIAFLHKPFNSETLGRKIREVLDR